MNAAVLKTVESQDSVGSNPTLSATIHARNGPYRRHRALAAPGRLTATLTATKTGRQVLAAVLTCLLLLVPGGCSAPSVPEQPAGREQQAEVIVAEWLSSMAAGDAARAWQLMHPVTRSDVYHGLPPDFTHDVVSAQWGQFIWAVQPANFFDVHYLVDLRLANGLGSAPRFLIDRGLIHTHEVGDALVPYVGVRIDEPGEDGVLSNG